MDVVPNVGVDCCWPKAPVDAVPKGEPPVCAPKAVVGLPNGFGAKGLLAAGVAWPNPCWVPNEFWPNGLVDDCPNGLVEPNMAAAELMMLMMLLLAPRSPEAAAAACPLLVYRCTIGYFLKVRTTKGTCSVFIGMQQHLD